MQNTPIRKNSIIRKDIKYSLRLIWILFQLVSKHRNISRVVKIMKKTEIPSIPTVKFKFKFGSHISFSTNWKFPVDLSNTIHRTREVTNVKLEKHKAILFNKFLFQDGVISRKKDPTKGKINKWKIIFLLKNIMIIYNIL